MNRTNLGWIIVAMVVIVGFMLFPGHRQPRPVAVTTPHSAATKVVRQPLPDRPRPAPSVIGLRPLQNCQAGTVDVFVAHEDDDLLFMNPQLEQDIISGSCIRTIYLTAGDAGEAADYWQGREAGSQASYALMFNAIDDWEHSKATINGQAIEQRSLLAQPRVVLHFVRLPDGGVGGRGFAATGHESLYRAARDPGTAIHAVDSDASYSSDQLVRLLQTIILFDKPKAIYTSAFQDDVITGDHLDHTMAGRLTHQAWQAANRQGTLLAFVGYPMGRYPVNLTDDEAATKQQVFDAYESHDTVICPATDYCPYADTYNAYFSRMYKIEATPAP